LESALECDVAIAADSCAHRRLVMGMAYYRLRDML